MTKLPQSRLDEISKNAQPYAFAGSTPIGGDTEKLELLAHCDALDAAQPSALLDALGEVEGALEQLKDVPNRGDAEDDVDDKIAMRKWAAEALQKLRAALGRSG